MAGKENVSSTNEDLLKMLECPVCLEMFDEASNAPIAIDCQHPLCSQCVSKLQQAGSIKCPTCQVTCKLKSSDVAKLPRDIARIGLIDILKKNKKQANMAKLCTACEEKEEAIAYCEVCEEYLCSECAKSHKRMKTTKTHKLDDVQSRTTDGGKSVESSVSVLMCEHEGHEKQVLVNFCSTCDVLICDTCSKADHASHSVQLAGSIYSSKSEELSEMLTALKEKVTKLTEGIDEVTKAVIEAQVNLTSDIKSQFQLYQNILRERQAELLNKVEQWCESRTQPLNKAKGEMDEIKRQISVADTAIREDDRIAFLKDYRSLKQSLRQGVQWNIVVPDMTSLRYSQVCPSDDFAKIVTGLGSIQQSQRPEDSEGPREASENSWKYLGPAPESASFRSDATSTPYMEMLKSIGFDSDSTDVQHIGHLSEGDVGVNLMDYVVNTDTRSSTNMMNHNKNAEVIYNRTTNSSERHKQDATAIEELKSNVLDHVIEFVQESIPNEGLKSLYNSLHVKELTSRRFQTWNLTGSWKVSEAEVVMYSKTREEAEQCLRLLNETVTERRISVRKDTMALLDSDKWQMVNTELSRKYPGQVATCVDHDRQEVVCLATCAAALDDITDKTDQFLRDNDVKQAHLTFTKDTLKAILKQKRSLNKLCASYSQFCVQVTKESDTSICVKGIGIGFGQALKHINKLAQKSAADDDDRFDSDEEDDDDDDDDEDTRFDDDKPGQCKGPVAMEMVMGAVDVAGVCLPGDNRALYAVCGDMTALSVEAIVNAADPKLKHDGGLAKVLVKKGGQAIQDECKLRVTRHGPLNVGDVFSSSTGNLPSRAIIHAVGPKWKDGNSGEMNALGKAVYNSLQCAAGQRLASVAIPAIGAGTYKLPVARVCDVIVGTVNDFLTEKPRCSIREVYFIDITAATAQGFAEALRGSFKECDFISCKLDKSGRSNPQQAAGGERRGNVADTERGNSTQFVLMM